MKENFCCRLKLDCLPDETGVYTITEEYAATCGYSVSSIPQTGYVELRASYFSCHTDNKVCTELWLDLYSPLEFKSWQNYFYGFLQDDKEFAFNFNLIATHKEKVATYALNNTCSPPLPWSAREVTCEANYMEVRLISSRCFFKDFFRYPLILISL